MESHRKRRKWRDAREGAYLLRTNLKEETPEQLWKKYTQLSEAEAAFRALKANCRSGQSFTRLNVASKPTSWSLFSDMRSGSRSSTCSNEITLSYRPLRLSRSCLRSTAPTS